MAKLTKKISGYGDDITGAGATIIASLIGLVISMFAVSVRVKVDRKCSASPGNEDSIQASSMRQGKRKSSDASFIRRSII